MVIPSGWLFVCCNQWLGITVAINLGNAYGKIIIDGSGAISTIGQVHKGLGGLGGPFGIAAKAATGFGLALGVGLAGAGAALTGIVSSSTKVAADLESQLSGVKAITGATTDEMMGLKGLITNLGVDPNLKVSALEAAQAIEMLGRNGMDVADIMDGAARSTVLLANATGGDFAQSADIATDVMALWKIEAADMEQAVNGITSVVTNSKFAIGDYQYALAQGGGVAAASGVEFNDFNATIAAISPLFASGQDAGTSFKTFLQRLIPQSKGAAKMMQELGIITEDGSNTFFDANGNLKDMASIAGILEDALGDLSEERKNDALATIFGADSMRAAIGLAETGADRFRELQNEMAQTSAADAAATRMDNLRGSMEILDGIVETLKISIGDEFIPIVKQGIDGLAKFLTGNQDTIVGFFGGIADWVGYLGGQAGPILENVTSYIFGLMEAFQSGGLFGSRSGSFGSAGLLVALGLDNETVGTIEDIFNRVSGAYDAFESGIGLFDTRSGSFGSAGILSALGVDAGTQDIIQGIFDGIQSTIDGFYATLDTFQQAIDAYDTGGITGLITFISEQINTAGPTVFTSFDSWSELIWGWIDQAIILGANKLNEWVLALGEWVANPDSQVALRGFGESIAGVIMDALGFGMSNQERANTAMGLLVTGLLTSAGALIANLGIIGGEILAGIVGGLFNAIAEGGYQAQTWSEFTAMLEWMGEVVSGMSWDQIGWLIVQGIIAGFTSGFDDLYDAAKNLVTGAYDATAGEAKIESPSKLFANIGENISLGVAQGISAASVAPIDAMSAITSDLALAAQAPVSTARPPQVVDNSKTTKNEFSMSIGQINNGEAGVMQGFATLEAMAA